MCTLTLKFLKANIMFVLKIYNSINNCIFHGENQPNQEVVISFLKHYDDCALTDIELIYIVERHNSLITINCGTYFVFWDFAFKVCNIASIMPSFCEQFILANFSSVVLRRIILIIWRMVFHTFLVLMYMCLNIRPLKESL